MRSIVVIVTLCICSSGYREKHSYFYRARIVVPYSKQFVYQKHEMRNTIVK